MSFPQFQVASLAPTPPMAFFISTVAFIILLTLLILIHEWGHYICARLLGVEVEEFGFGLPPRAKKLFKRKGTLFSLNWIPFGGFVRLKGENAIDLESRYAKGSFGHAPIPSRILILCGGVLMNFLLAFTLLTFGFSVGRWIPNFYSSIDELQQAASRGEISVKFGVYINEVLPDGGAAKAGIQKDTMVKAIDGKEIKSPEELVALQKGKQDVEYTIVEEKTQTERKVNVAIDSEGRSGIAISAFATELSAPHRSFGQAVVLALKETKFMTIQTIKGMGNLVRSLVTRGHVPEGITGIVGIAVLTSGAVQEGLMTYLRLVALLSLSLAILNILPLPALDGGRLLFVLAEMVRRKPLNQRFEMMTNTIGFFLLIGLILIITYNDVIQLF